MRIMRRQSLNQQKGVVIVVALFIVMLVSTMAYVMLLRLMRDTERTSLILRAENVENIAEGSIVWAMDLLRNNWNNKKPNQLADQMPVIAPEQTVDGFQIKTIIYDMQSRFNLNNLSDPSMQTSFVQLLRIVDKKISAEEALALAKAITAWISQNVTDADRYYLELPTPYRPAHRALQSASELQLIKGMTPSLYHALQPYVVALPTVTQINIQTAFPEVIVTLSPTMTLDAANLLTKIRTEKPFKSSDEVAATDIGKNFSLPTNKMTVISNYFLVETIVSIENQHTVIYTLLERSGAEKKAILTRLWQSRGIW